MTDCELAGGTTGHDVDSKEEGVGDGNFVDIYGCAPGYGVSLYTQLVPNVLEYFQRCIDKEV